MASAEATHDEPAATSTPTPTPTQVRRLSLASQLEAVTPGEAFARAIQENPEQLKLARAVLRKATGKRTLEEIHVLKSLLGSSKLLDMFANLDACTLVFCRSRACRRYNAVLLTCLSW
ncbi:hypothetical protein PINS_up004712 [Pythium insidiosum]|nr:hypothetical protein PINS_up004712 [Pythium insidiosum]